MEPIPQVSEALNIIKDVTGTSGRFLMNKHQCERLVRRLRGFGLVLEPVGNARANSQDQMRYPGLDELLTVLKRAKDLLSNYRDVDAIIPSVLGSTENRQAFKEIHNDLDALKSMFCLEDFEYPSESKKSAVFTADADQDLKEFSANLEGLVHRSEPSKAAALSQIVETVKLVVSEKTSQSSMLPSYLNIDPRLVEVRDAVRIPEGKSDQEVKDGVLVRFARYLMCEIVIKEFKSGDANWDRAELLKEVRSLMELHHPHVVQLIGFAQNEERCLILMELMDGDLRNFMKQRPLHSASPFTRPEELSIISQIAKGVYYLHEQQCVHGELKCSNILVRRRGNGHIEVKISDLRSSQKLRWDPVRSKRSRSRWDAPEVRTYYGDDPVVPMHALLKKADTYSFGMVCYEVVTGMLPFQDIRGEELKKRIEAGHLKQELPDYLDENLRGLIESCWASDPDDRPTFAEICHGLEFIRCRQSAGALTRMFPKISCKALVEGLPGGKGKDYGDVPSHCDHVQQMDSDKLGEFVRISPKQLQKGKEIGRGAYGTVYEATWLGCKFALKMFKYAAPVGTIREEVRLLIELRHPCIVQLVGLSVTGPSCSIVMERMGSNLRELMDSRKSKRKLESDAVVMPFALRDAVHIIQRIAQAMLFLHFRGVVHRDLKALNVLVPLNSNSIDVKISDFGFSQFADQEPGMVKAGTTLWRAPELERRELDSATRVEYNLKAADVFGFAMTCFEILTGEYPFKLVKGKAQNVDQLMSDKIKGRRPELPDDLNPDLKKLVEDCWDGEPEKRPTFVHICQVLDKISEGLKCSGSL